MYKLLLIFKYLRKRRIAWVSLIAVTLCTAMVLVVISVMGGWLRMFREINHGLVGDVVIRHKYNGPVDYVPILAELRKLPQVKAAIPMIDTYGVINVDDQIHDAVQVEAFGDLDQVGDVNSFKRGLYRQTIQPIADIDADPKLSAQQKADAIKQIQSRPPTFDKPLDPQAYRDIMFNSKIDVSKWPGIIVGSGVIGIKKDDNGVETGRENMYTAWVQLSVLGMGTNRSDEDLSQRTSTRTYWIVDDCRTKFYPTDFRTVYVPFEYLQKDLGMDAQPYTEKIGDKTIQGVEPATCSEIQIALADGVDPDAGLAAIQKVVAGFQPNDTTIPLVDTLVAEPWEQRQAQFLGAVEKEEGLLTILFGIISIVAIFLVFCIFFMIVVEKTRDIGVIKSVGATSWGVAQIFLGYGLSIGILGAGLGLLTAYEIVHNINELHAWMGRALHVRIWDPETYAFDTIPNTMDHHDVAWIVSIAVLSALLGAVIPAIVAARKHPVDALRWE